MIAAIALYVALCVAVLLACRVAWLTRRVRALESRLAMAQQPRTGSTPQSPTMSAHLAAIDEAHPGWRLLVRGGRFKRWLDSQSYELQGWASSMDPGKASALLHRYKADEARGWA